MATFDESQIRRGSSGRFTEKPEAAESEVALRRLVDELDDPDHPDRMGAYYPEDGLLDDHGHPRAAIAGPKIPQETSGTAVDLRGFDGQRRDFGQELQEYLSRNGLGQPVPADEANEYHAPPRTGWLARRREARTERQRKAEVAALTWRRTCERHDAVSLAHAEHEADVLAVLERPTLTDLGEPSTERLYRAMVAASDLRSERHDAPGAKAYTEAVTELDVAWRAANHHADRVRLSRFAPDERKRLTQAHSLITKALDDAASPAERQSCYRKAMSLIDGLVPVPAPATKAIRDRTPLSLGS